MYTKFKHISSVIIGLFFLQFSIVVKAQTTIPADNPLIEYSGRIDFSDPKAPRYSYSGGSVRAQFQGTRVSAILEDEGNSNYYNIIIDNVVKSRINLSSGRNTYLLASGLSNTTHEIEIYKITESIYGKTKFCGFILDVGKMLVPLTNLRTRLIEYIGNSVTCGAGIEGASGSAQSNTNENHYLTYAAITSRNLNARHFAVCKSGVGLFLNWSGFVNNYTESPSCMKNYYNRMHYNDATPLYKFTQKPDLICVNLGTNDFARGVDEAKFEQAYYNFIDTLQLRNPGACIICLIGPMMSGYNLNHIRPIVQRVVTNANAKNKGKVFFFELSQQGALGVGSDNHPNVAQHAKNAQELTNYINTIMSCFKSITTSDDPLINKTLFTIYPNPTSDYFMVEGVNSNSQIEIYDVLGKKIVTQFLTINNTKIDISELDQGIYFFRIIGEATTSQIGKLIKQ